MGVPAFAEDASLDLHKQCLRSQSGPECFERYYKPVADFCARRKDDCLPNIPHDDPGALSFKRCFHSDACTLEAGLLRVNMRPGDQRAEVADPFRSAYLETTEYDLSFRIPETSVLTNDNGSIVIAQLHADNGQSPTMALRYKENGDLAVTLRHLTGDQDDDTVTEGKEVYAFREQIQRGRWYNVKIIVRTGPDGTLRVAIDGRTKVVYDGPLGYRGRIGYFKFGAYDWTKSLKSPFAVEYRSYRRGTTHYDLSPVPMS